MKKKMTKILVNKEKKMTEILANKEKKMKKNSDQRKLRLRRRRRRFISHTLINYIT